MMDTNETQRLFRDINAAIELLAKHGYTIWNGGGRIVSDFERRKRELEHKIAEEFRALRHERNIAR